MTLERFGEFVTEHRKVLMLASMLTTFAGAALLLDRPKGNGVEWLGVLFIALGGTVLVGTAWPAGSTPRLAPPSVATRFLRWVSWDGRLVRLFPALGVGVVLGDIAYNLALSGTPALQTEDTIALLGAFALISYALVPGRFARERDFVLVFCIALNAILVVPLLVARLYYLDFERSVDLYSWVALAPETSSVLSLLGVANSVHSVSGFTAPGLTFTPRNLPVQVTVVITTACSGIYSFGIFASAFLAFILTEYERPSRKMWLLVGLGFVTSYLANIMRMVVIVLVGYYTETPETDLQNILLAHSFAGWLIFIAWIAPFWAILLKFLPRPAQREEITRVPNARSEPRCRICSGVLTPTVVAIRCVCGMFYHQRCMAAEGRCPNCGHRFQAENDLALGSA